MAVVLVDYYGNPIRSFKTWREANKFRITRNRLDWRII